MSFLRNRWLWILGPAILLLVLLMLLGVAPDILLLTFGTAVFVVVAFPAAKYFWRSLQLIGSGYTEREDFNIVGWALVLLGLMETQVYRWVWIQLDRPDWLADQYWSTSFVYTMLVGFILVAWSARRAPPDVLPGSPSFGFITLFVGFISGVGLMLSGILPAAVKFIVGLIGGAVQAVF